MPPPSSTHESLQKASPGAKEKGPSKSGSSSGARKNASVRKRQKKEDSFCKQTRRCSAVAMDYWNRNEKPEGLPEYVLVEPVDSCAFISVYSFVFHANFKARPKNDPSVEAELFFAELKGNVYKKKRYQITKVCSLGPSNSVTSGYKGCKACDHPVREVTLHHPEEGFIVGRRMHLISD